MIFGIWRARGDGGVRAAVSRHDVAACGTRRYNEGYYKCIKSKGYSRNRVAQRCEPEPVLTLT